MLSVFALNYSIPMVIAPQYATFGRQTFCDRVSDGSLGEQLDCSNTRHLVKPCSEMTSNLAARRICIPSVTSTFLNRVTINFPFFGAIFFASQFAFLGCLQTPFAITFNANIWFTDQVSIWLRVSSLWCAPRSRMSNNSMMPKRLRKKDYWQVPGDKRIVACMAVLPLSAGKVDLAEQGGEAFYTFFQS